MRIELSNINRIKKASIKIDGLTVIAGENDSGKSTLSKMIFSNIKAHANIINYEKMGLSEKIKPIVYKMYKRIGLPIRRVLYQTNNSLNLPRSADEFIEEFSSLKNVEIENVIGEILNKIRENNQLRMRTKALLERDLHSIEICLKNSNNPAALLQPEVFRLIESEFINKITSEGASESHFSIIDDNESSIMSYDIIDNNVFNLEYADSFTFFKDATYVESPLHFQLQDVLKRAGSYIDFGNPGSLWAFRSLMVPMHVKDFSEKINTIVDFSEKTEISQKFVDLIRNTTNGSFVYDRKTRKIIFKNILGDFSLNNVASGIKSFGVLEIFLSNDIISPEKMLLWDEPENHLHPQWQVYFADILVQLAKSGIPIVVCSHSPYFIQAIRHFSAKYSIENNVDYYTSRLEKDGLYTFDEVTADLNRVFAELANPMNQIMDFG